MDSQLDNEVELDGKNGEKECESDSSQSVLLEEGHEVSDATDEKRRRIMHG